MIKTVKKIWGKEEWLINSELYCAKYLYLKYGFQCSLHYHRNKDETFYVVVGIVKIEIDKEGNFIILHKGEQIRIYPYTLHRFTAMSPTAKLMEISTHHADSDSYRIQESGEIK